MSRPTQWIQTHFNQFFAIVAGLAIVIFALLAPGWWGDRAFGVLIGVAILAIVVTLTVLIIDNTYLDEDKVLPWILVLVPTVTALIMRGTARYNLVWPIQFKTPAIPSPPSLFFILIAIFMIGLLIVFVRALHRGEGVAIETHWGGLGGGLGGFRLSTPLIYLLGIVFLLLVSSAVAWRLFPPPQDQQTSPSASSSPSPSPPTSSPSPSSSLPGSTTSPTSSHP
ncbi:MAG TPA: hypothetical protein VHR36_01720 [Pyrinomonadaceae bacterium]|jgi:hypothetical protein|nr:hypothetical protein [Pyrinomonadaceae bacterium]